MALVAIGMLKVRSCRVYLALLLLRLMFAAGLTESLKAYPVLSLLGWAALAKAGASIEASPAGGGSREAGPAPVNI